MGTPAGTLDGHVVVIDDDTSLRRSLSKILQDSSTTIAQRNALTDKFRVLFEHSSDPHFIFMEGGITDCNDATVQILKLKGKNDVLKIHPAALSPLYQPDGRLSSEKSVEMDRIALEKGFHRFEWVHQNAKGEPFPVQVTVNAVTIDGKPAMIAVWHDLSVIKKREEELRRLNDKMKSDLQAAWAVQKALLPVASPLVKGFRAAWSYKPCDALGGDILNIFKLDEKHIGFYVLDVTGHGLAASLLSVAVSHFLSPFSESSFVWHVHDGSAHAFAEPVQVAEKLNQQFSSNPEVAQLFSMIYGIFSVDTREFRYVCAGHPPPLVVSARGARWAQGSDLCIGVTTDALFSERKLKLEPGERLYLYSDGVTEAKSATRELFGAGRFVKALSSMAEQPLSASLERVVGDVERWCRPGIPDDDITLLVCESGT